MRRDWKCPACGLAQTTDVDVGDRARLVSLISLVGGVALAAGTALTGHAWVSVLVAVLAGQVAFLAWRASRTHELFVTCSRCFAVVQLHRTEQDFSKAITREPGRRE